MILFLKNKFQRISAGNLLKSNIWFWFSRNRNKNSAGTNGGPRSRVCAHLTIRKAPHRHQRKFFGARVSFKHLHQTHRSHTQSFGTLEQILKYPPFVWGEGGDPRKFFLVES